MSAKTIAIVEDDRVLNQLMSIYLKDEGFAVKEFYDGESAMKTIKTDPPNLLVLDLILPGVDGLEICRVLRADPATTHIPIVMVTGKGTETDRVVGLEMGADDYIVKPFNPPELVARVKAVLRRAPGVPLAPVPPLQKEGLEIDPQRFVARVEGKSIPLTATEFKILLILAGTPGKVFTREEILDRLWGTEKSVLDRTIDVHVKSLREKMGVCAHLLKTVRGIGYKLDL
ncbi:MAG: response regulator transcription factor [bacterium]